MSNCRSNNLNNLVKHNTNTTAHEYTIYTPITVGFLQTPAELNIKIPRNKINLLGNKRFLLG